MRAMAAWKTLGLTLLSLNSLGMAIMELTSSPGQAK
jgi:hypothetical protein